MSWPIYYSGDELLRRSKRRARARAVVLSTLVIGAGLASTKLLNHSLWANAIKSHLPGTSFQKHEIAALLGKRTIKDDSVVKLESNGEKLEVHYSVDARFQQSIAQLFKRGGVPYGAFVAMDAKTGQILAMVSHSKGDENFSLKASFPAASVFKIITAAAGLESGKLQHNSLIPVKGSYHTLYRTNVLKAGGLDPSQSPRRSRLISFQDSFAKSVNSVFGKIGIFGVGPEGLRKTASRFFFGRPIPFEMPVDVSQSNIPDDTFGVAESASGFTRHNTLSPIHGAMIAAAVVNDGVLMEPTIVNKIVSADSGKVEYEAKPLALGSVIDKQTAHELELMMHRTIINGTSRRAFRGANRSLALSDVFLGGKTGTLNGWDPPGRYDWFVGFGERDNTKIAVAALCIHGEMRGIKASAVARQFLEDYFRSVVAENPVKRSHKQSI